MVMPWLEARDSCLPCSSFLCHSFFHWNFSCFLLPARYISEMFLWVAAEGLETPSFVSSLGFRMWISGPPEPFLCSYTACLPQEYPLQHHLNLFLKSNHGRDKHECCFLIPPPPQVAPLYLAPVSSFEFEIGTIVSSTNLNRNNKFLWSLFIILRGSTDIALIEVRLPIAVLIVFFWTRPSEFPPCAIVFALDLCRFVSPHDDKTHCACGGLWLLDRR